MGNSVTSQVLFHPPNPPTPLLPYQKYFWIETSTKLLIPAIFIAHESNPNARFTLLYSHGHDVDLGLIYDFLVDLSRLLRVNIMSYDYGGYGMGMVKKTSVVLPNGGSGRKANRGKRVGSNPYDNEEDQYDTDSNSDSSDDYEDRTSPQVEIIQPSEKQCYADIEACHNYLVYNKGISPAHILLYGKSLGSGPTLWLAQRLYRRYFKCREAALSRQMSGQYKAIMAQMKKNGSDGSVTSGASKKGLKVQYYSSSSNISLDGQSHMELRTSPKEKDGGNGKNNDADKMPVLPLAGVILHGAFLSVMRIMLNMGFTASGDCFPNADRIGDVKCPIYIIHAKEDEVIPFSHGKSLYETIVMANGGKVFPPFWADDAAHNNIEQKYATAYVKRLQQFIKHCDVRVTKECGDNSGERVKYVRDRSLSVEKSKSFGGRVGSNVSGKSSSSKSKSKSKSKNSKIGNDTSNVVTKNNSSSPPTRGRSKNTPRNENRLNDNLQNHRTSSRSRRMNPIEKRSISANRGTQVENQSPPAVASSNARPRTPSRAQTRGQLSLTSSRNRGRATVRDKSTPAHGTLAQPSTLNKKVLSKSVPSTVSSAVISKSASSDARGRVAGAANTSRGRGRSRDSRNCMQDPLEIQRARSNSRARERKKRGTLVMRGNHEDEEFIKNDGGDGAAARKASGKGTNTKCVRKESAGDIGTDSSISTTSPTTATVATVNSTITDDWYDGFVYLKSPDTKALSSGISGKQERIDASTLAVDQNGGTERESRNPAN